ncbi:MAG TPA: carboxymuconolactone decarboxylase family protein [Steroidobacteraceae bacterium]
MGERFVELERSALSAGQRQVYDAIAAGPRSAVPAPFHIFLHSPELADHAQRLGEFLRYRTGLPKRLSEIAILVTAKHWSSSYEWQVHAREARAAGVSDEIIAAIDAGQRPSLSGDDALVYDFTAEFFARRDVPDHLFDAATARFGTRTVAELASILGYYSMLAIVMHVFRVKAS